MEPIVIPLRPILIFIVVLTRVGGLVTFAPFWNNQAATMRVRVALALMLALALTPAVMPRLATPPTDPIALALVIMGELVIGCVFGFVGRVVVSALETAAEVLSFQLGLSLASTIDPSTRAQTTVIGTLAQMFGLMILMGADSHHWVLAATARSFESVQPGNLNFSPELAQLLLRLSADAIAVGVALAAPTIIVLLAVEFILAVAGRAAPQLQIMVLGFPVKILAGIWLTGATLYFMPGAVRQVIGAIKTGLSRAISAM
jgi:flagellar biosynthetic protein FliR